MNTEAKGYSCLALNVSSTNSDVASFAGSWMRFFGALQSPLSQLENTEHPNSHFCEYAVDRLEYGFLQCFS